MHTSPVRPREGMVGKLLAEEGQPSLNILLSNGDSLLSDLFARSCVAQVSMR